MKYTQLPENLVKKLAVNAGILLSDFNVATGAFSAANIIGATSGGVNVVYTPTYKDWGADVDNCPKNTKEMNQLDSVECMLSGSFVTVNTDTIARLLGAADIGTVDTTKVTPRRNLTAADYKTIYYVSDYSEYNGATNGGRLVIKMTNALSTGGFNMQSTDLEKGTFDFEFKGFMSIDAPDTMPMEFYVVAGTSESGDYGLEFVSAAGAASGDTELSGMTETPGSGESYVYQTGYNLIVPAQGAILAGTAWTAWNGTDDITATTGMDIVLAVIVTATGAAQHAGKTVVVAKA